MKTTAAALRKLQDYYASLEIRPSIKEVAQETNMPVATVARYLNGTNQTGDLERVRALCIALDKHDLLDDLPKSPTFASLQDVLALIMEIKKESRESNLEELERVRKLHEESEKRLIGELDRAIKSRDFAINEYTKRIEQLEADKKNQALVNKTLLEDKTQINTEMLYCRKTKRKYEVFCVVMLLGIIAYISIFDLPNPSNGITYLLSTILG